jgi:hypothetical protein
MCFCSGLIGGEERTREFHPRKSGPDKS